METSSLLSSPQHQSNKSNKSHVLFACVGLVCIAFIATALALYFTIWRNEQSSDKSSPKRPNVIFILMDDVGFTDIGYNSNQYVSQNDHSFVTPTIDRLARNGITLNYHYSEPGCSPTRSALFTARYAWRTGVDRVVWPHSNSIVPPNITMMSEILQSELKYNTLLVGKWHLGNKYRYNLPFNRGFDECLFFTQGWHTYYSKQYCDHWSLLDENAGDLPSNLTRQRNQLWSSDKPEPEMFCGFDLWNERYENERLTDEYHRQTYNERLFTNKVLDFINRTFDDEDPFFVYYAMPTPHWYLEQPPLMENGVALNYSLCDHIQDANRKLMCQSMQYADHLIEEMVDFLQDMQIMDNTVIIWASDNGGSSSLNASGQNLPLHGSKGTPFEGAVRTAAFIAGGYIDGIIGTNDSVKRCVYDKMFYVADWFPTIFALIGYPSVVDNDDIDGIGLWTDMLRQCNVTAASEKHEEIADRNLIVSVRRCYDEYFTASYIRSKQWKLLVNASISWCPNTVRSGRSIYYASYDGSYSIVPNERVYNEYLHNDELMHLFQSDCYDGLNSSERQNSDNDLFQYSEFLLYNVESDPIEACNVAKMYPEIVDELFAKMHEIVNENGSYHGNMRAPPMANSVLAQIETFNCEQDEVYMVSWADDERYANDSFADWEYVWRTAIDRKLNCSK